MSLEEIMEEVERLEPVSSENLFPFLNELQSLRDKCPSEADAAKIRQLCEDAETWRDAADWRNNCSRILEVLRLLPPLL